MCHVDEATRLWSWKVIRSPAVAGRGRRGDMVSGLTGASAGEALIQPPDNPARPPSAVFA